MALTELEIRKAKAKDRPYMVRDDNGLYLEVIPAGGKYWRLRYWTQGKEKKVSLGVYPEVGLKEAREKRDTFKRDLAAGIDPKAKRKEGDTFETVARDWFSTQIKGVRSEGHARTVLLRLGKFLFPVLGGRPIADIAAPELLALLRGVEAAGAIETAHRVKQIAGAIFRFGIATGRCVHDISADLKGALVPKSVVHHSSLTAPKDIAVLMEAIEVYRGSPVVKTALYFSAYSMLRPGEVRRLEWAEVDFYGMEIRIPAEKMKKRRLHIVPMARQVVEILEHLRPLTGGGKYVFPSIRTPNGNRPMSENTIRVALRAMGFSNEEMTAHGFRSMASTNLNEQGWDGDLVELQLAHVEGNAVRAAYNYAEHLPERRKMMQAWADWLDGLLEKK